MLRDGKKKLVLPLLKKLNLGQNIRENGPEAHLAKAGTPSMGGLIFLIPFAIFEKDRKFVLFHCLTYTIY